MDLVPHGGVSVRSLQEIVSAIRPAYDDQTPDLLTLSVKARRRYRLGFLPSIVIAA
jgi:hypothetical protein